MKVPFFRQEKEDKQIGTEQFAVGSVAKFVDRNEAIALSSYARDHGLDPNGDLAASIHDAIAAREMAASREDWLKANGELVRAYAQLNAKTAKNNVTGRTVIDSRQFLLRHTLVEWTFGIFCLFGAVGTEILGNHYGIQRAVALAASGPGLDSPYYTIYSTGLVYLLPFFWGGVGSFLYLIKMLSERAAARQFSSVRLRGSLPRLVLGAVLGGVVANLYGEQANAVVAIAVPDISTTGGLGASALAFLAGLGVKAVYGTFNAIIQTVTIWIEDIVPNRPEKEVAKREAEAPPEQASTEDADGINGKRTEQESANRQ